MYLRVKVTPNAKKELITKASADRWDISVKDPALRNLANARVIELVALELDISIKQVRIISGHHHPIKLLSIAID